MRRPHARWNRQRVGCPTVPVPLLDKRVSNSAAGMLSDCRTRRRTATGEVLDQERVTPLCPRIRGWLYRPRRRCDDPLSADAQSGDDEASADRQPKTHPMHVPHLFPNNPELRHSRGPRQRFVLAASDVRRRAAGHPTSGGHIATTRSKRSTTAGSRHAGGRARNCVQRPASAGKASTSPPACTQLGNPPPRCATDGKPIAVSVIAASAERLPRAQ